jgi:hypothetical protein
MSNFGQQADSRHSAIRQILLEDWDPIGIKHIPEAQDEYDAYVPQVEQLLSQGASIGQIFEYLWELETQHMALPGDQERTKRIAERLARIR